MPTRSELRGVRWNIRQRSWRLQSALIRKAARWAFDLPRFGTGPLERLAVSLILATTFGFAALGASHIATMETKYRLALAGLAFLTVLVTSAVLVLWTRDDEALEAEQLRLREDLVELREQEADLKDALDEEAELEELERDEAAAWRERNRPRTKRCPYCREIVSIRALKCGYCGEILDEELARERAQTWNPGVAAVLSFLIPGMGQIYKGQVVAGLVWLFTLWGLYAMGFLFLCCGGFIVLPLAVILHVVCLFDAASGR
jgi:TM2 domain-containing membrane protein YozV